MEDLGSYSPALSRVDDDLQLWLVRQGCVQLADSRREIGVCMSVFLSSCLEQQVPVVKGWTLLPRRQQSGHRHDAPTSMHAAIDGPTTTTRPASGA